MANAVTGGTGYQIKAPYNVALYVAADNGTNVSATCASATVVAGGSCIFAGTAITATGLRLGGPSTKANGPYFRVSAPAYAETDTLAAGLYSDTLTINFNVSP